MDARDEAAGAGRGDAAELVAALIDSRRTVLPRWLGAPGPDAAQLRSIFEAAAAAPDHGRLVPWRFVLVPPAARDRLGAVFAEALRARDPSAGAADVAKAAAKAHHAPVLLLAVARLGGDAVDPGGPADREAGADRGDQSGGMVGGMAGGVAGDGPIQRGRSATVGPAERLVSLGCALQNMQLMAHAMGYGAALTSGQALDAAPMRALFGLQAGEQAVCFLSIGTVQRRPGGVQRPQPVDFVRVLGEDDTSV